ncbi:uncharacterized protein LOC116852726 [Odontomachus brunneus]|uniref:uncharacterized protein LOC116852726 n=1 Tax=Odontomachus brunneus TaxID=486640 RepID=UPI0013F1CBBD|nr:uncharacterized protein LOC116852726 [Odontomachus brunneus]XP_032689243.1 uncharacterized protein LOC116852726 [Odontomachus brunneus]XP_032689244.1 uncharacterized protein LOC116852726 [Odontomachus brunneus]XP_032689245.1 uncharacterized protein LOC116852726 [Odontomachus brunneus]XP_032689246.1 uncharacterized protein LOC116852726 [Odontomachus brunneus]
MIINKVECKNITPLSRNIFVASSNNFENNNEVRYVEYNDSYDTYNIHNDLEVLNTNSDTDSKNQIEDVSNYISDSDSNDHMEHINCTNNCRSTNITDDSLASLLFWLQEWTIKNNITHVALNELMCRIKPKYPELPKDARTLLRTPRKINVDVVTPGHYYHFGICNYIEKLLSRCSFHNDNFIEVNINIDGLPLFKSSNSQVYPISCNLVENYNKVEIIGIYHGYEKPTSANVFLQRFTEEANYLTIHGIKIKDHIYSFKINSFICDVPAKNFVTYIKGHSVFYACAKCTVKVMYSYKYYCNRVIYPYINNCHLRTNNDFRQKLQEHHTGTSILESIPNINMITDFSSDPMHLIFLGIVKKLITFMVKTQKKIILLSNV